MTTDLDTQSHPNWWLGILDGTLGARADGAGRIDRYLGLPIQPGNRFCKCRVLVLPGERPVVAMIQIDGTDGVSVTNASEHIAAAVARDLLSGATLNAVTWVEHYPASIRGSMGASYDTVTYEAIGPLWCRLGVDGFRALTGLTLDELGIR